MGPGQPPRNEGGDTQPGNCPQAAAELRASREGAPAEAPFGAPGNRLTSLRPRTEAISAAGLPLPPWLQCSTSRDRLSPCPGNPHPLSAGGLDATSLPAPGG